MSPLAVVLSTPDSRAIFVKTDVSQPKDVENLIQETVKVFGRLDIHANALAPGFIQTPLMGALQDPDTPPELIKAGLEEICRRQPLGSRLGEPEEIAGAAVFLASQDASFVTGHTVLVDGGYTAA
ncbi:hypothetical protein MPDQ_003429 [Monascus purpureus]|uniref:Uncharacterized protein n=1 Tax=Monascus purpureus TaxID=5098 RepID=A0A507QN60_MONPU|nr:hypothetical protein MPDQ_003429 [Monascus purpureus]